MKKCQLLEKYLIGELDPEKMLDFENHIKECEFCEKELRLMVEIENYLEEIPKVRPPENFSEEVISKIKTYKKTVAGWYWYLTFSIVLFFAMIFAVSIKGVDKLVNDFMSLVASLHTFTTSVLTAIVTISESVYNILTPGKINGIVLTMVFVIICMIFLKSVKLFSSVER